MEEYIGLELPYDFDEFDDYDKFTKKEAKEYFEWYTSKFDERIAYLEQYLIRNSDSTLRLDYTVESLEKLWKCFVEYISATLISEEYFKCYRFSEQTKAMGTDAAMYFGQVVCKNMEGVYWGYFTKPKKQIYVNEPVLLGFKCCATMPSNPRSTFTICISNYLDDPERYKNILYDTYKVWEDHYQK